MATRFLGYSHVTDVFLGPFFFFSYDRDGLVLVKHLQSYDFPFSLRLLLLPFFDFLLHRAAYVDCHVRDDRTAAAYWK